MTHCKKCNDTGVWVSTLDDTENTIIERCDYCKRFNSDLEAIRFVKSLVRRNKNSEGL